MKIKPLNKHDLIALLRTFSGKELKRFSLYLNSDYFSTRRALKSLYEEIKKYHPLYTHINCTKESLYSIVYPELSYNGGTMRDLLSSLYEAATDFVSLESYLNRKSSGYLKINELRQRCLPKNALKYLKESLNEDNIIRNIDSEYFLHNYNLQIEIVNLNMIYKNQITANSVNKLADEIKKAEIYLLIFSILEILANYNNLILFEERFHSNESEDYIKNAIKELYGSGLNKLIKGKNRFDFILNVYAAMLDAFFKRGNFKQYEIYRDLIKKHSIKFSNDEISLHYSKLINCCILGAKKSKNKDLFNLELINLYNTFLEKKYYRDKKTRFIPSNLYRAILLHAVKMDKTTWLINVINRYTPELQPADRENMKQYALAFFYYISGRSGEAMEAIGKLNITQFIFKYDIYNLKLRIYYEENNYTAAIELINTYRQYLRTDKMMPAARKVFHRTFMKYTRHLIMISEGSGKFEAGLEIQKLQNEDCVYKEWLIEKLSVYERAERKYYRAG